MAFLFSKKEFFSAPEKEHIVEAIRASERRTSGEIRVFVESRCRFVDPLDRAAEIFWTLQMDKTDDRNAVLIYVAMKDHQFAIFADDGIHKRAGEEFWQREIRAMSVRFRTEHYSDAIVEVIGDIGQALHTHFPYNQDTDKNELPDDIVFGK
jgi:uncharacterized membrane protein